MMMSLLVGFCCSSESHIAQPSFKVMLSNLRDRLKKEANSKNLNYYDSEFILNDKVCRFTGKKHEDYIYCVIQALFAVEHFTKTLLMNDFQNIQHICRILQKIAVKICGKDEINIEEEIMDLKLLKNMQDFYKNQEENYYYFSAWLIIELRSENFEMVGILYPENFCVIRTTIYSYIYVSHGENCKRKIWYRSLITNFENNIQFQITEWIKAIETDDSSCIECIKRLDNGQIEISLPSRFFLKLDQTPETQKRINGVNKSFHQLYLKDSFYELYAVVCEYKYPIDKKLSCYTLTLKGNNWYKLTKENIYLIDIETGEVLESDVGAKNDKDNKQAREMETDDIMINSWFYYYRKIQ